MKNILIVVGTRPNYIKVTQFKKVAAQQFANQFNIKIVHTGQHFDKSMADVFFQQLDIWPDYFLNISQATPNTQMAEIMLRLEKVITEQFQPDIILVPGDVNSTLAAALTAYKLGITLGHIESGLRSFDRSMPEEINRILVDEISDLYFVTEQSGIDNLIKEGKPESKIHLVGNTMIDTLVAFEANIVSAEVLKSYNLIKDEFILITIHRPATVDNKKGLEALCALLEDMPKDITIVFPMHPRTLNNIKKFNLENEFKSIENLKVLAPLDYFSFQNLIHSCKMVLTDSGGIQEETTFKQKPCLTLRPNTERPSTLEIGSNTLLDFNNVDILSQIKLIMTNTYKNGQIPKYWDGCTTERILKVILEA
ncbi:UDP-N-acetylglucosamine 2-epimerase (non-hydrolyzing) [Winogradskyella eckloniae]|uniref:non-hydrolyzing UDP-N-acetylglucosamine 2-epimerase n=1 Tax=Winogradskyella eckloniae TaxID=1089306 RepID=UPI00156530CC|nr:UDP-N-acetylglucosamine 2-epimerase (non-hydrolyzing) [Winogradskyella eckloniae]NRD20817.1 UDP-N-acetylglucosamine 2-epimerase (non-hydrolyzing) [Winogradskyella eckloniae]